VFYSKDWVSPASLFTTPRVSANTQMALHYHERGIDILNHERGISQTIGVGNCVRIESF